MEMYKSIFNKCLHPVAVPRITGTTLPVFRCGQCVNCLRQRGNELAVRTYREFHGQSIYFITFTYDNIHCPIKHIVDDVYVDTGSIRRTVEDVSSDERFFEDAPFKWMTKCKDGKSVRVKRYSPLIEILDEYDVYEPEAVGYEYARRRVQRVMYSYPTVYYKDLQLVLKQFRKKYDGVLKRYIIVPEYGSFGYRPHYHMLVFDLTSEQVGDLVKRWQYGSVDVRIPDRKDFESPSKLSMYISKYCTKGKFDCPYIQDGINKPRRCISENFGCGDERQFAELKAYLTAAFELGITDPFFRDDLPIEFNDYQLQLLKSRRSYAINGYPYPMPKYLINKCLKQTVRMVSPQYLRHLYYKNDFETYKQLFEKYGKEFRIPDGDKAKGIPKTYRLVASILCKEVTASLLADLVRDVIAEHRQYTEVLQACPDIDKYISSTNFRETALCKALERQFVSSLYNSSIF